MSNKFNRLNKWVRQGNRSRIKRWAIGRMNSRRLSNSRVTKPFPKSLF